jgi:phospholipid transport system transporter-binding protein
MSVGTAAAVPGDTAPGAAFELRRSSLGHFEAHGTLTFANARRVWEEGLAALRADPARTLEVDCAGITQADSAGLVVLLDWLAAARHAGRTLVYRYLPDPLLSLAAISDVKELLIGGFTP